MARDILITEVRVVLRADLYAVAALASAAVVVIGNVLHLSSARCRRRMNCDRLLRPKFVGRCVQEFGSYRSAKVLICRSNSP
jgi:hypothetical protein